MKNIIKSSVVNFLRSFLPSEKLKQEKLAQEKEMEQRRVEAEKLSREEFRDMTIKYAETNNIQIFLGEDGFPSIPTKARVAKHYYENNDPETHWLRAVEFTTGVGYKFFDDEAKAMVFKLAPVQALGAIGWIIEAVGLYVRKPELLSEVFRNYLKDIIDNNDESSEVRKMIVAFYKDAMKPA